VFPRTLESTRFQLHFTKNEFKISYNINIPLKLSSLENMKKMVHHLNAQKLKKMKLSTKTLYISNSHVHPLFIEDLVQQT